MQIVIIGGGIWGTVLAQILANNGHVITMLLRDKNIADDITTKHINTKYLPSLQLSASIYATTYPEEALQNKDLYVYASAFQYAEEILKAFLPLLPQKLSFLNISKGLREKDSLTMSAIVENVLQPLSPIYAMLSGPSFANEVASKKMTAVSIASKDIHYATLLRTLFLSEYFIVETTKDVIGVEIASAAKNVVAIASGILDALHEGNNANAFLITQGLAEITQLGLLLGADASTFNSCAGLGDLLLTSMGTLSRNRFVGNELGKGKTLNEIMNSMSGIAEGIPTSFALYSLAKQHNLHMPITQTVYNILKGIISLEELRNSLFNMQ
ncbi:MAG: NAD(P)H-dependent glycerol-3-phosphate dehydrogenase [Desulfovibrionaceae bacterium]